MSQNLEVTKEGIKLTYLRFLSDSAPGYILLLLIWIAYLQKLPMPLLGGSWLSVVPSDLSPETRVFLLIMLFLLATPTGLALNALGWFLLGPFHIWLLRLWHRLPRKIAFPIVGIRRAMNDEEITRFFKLAPSSDISAGRFYEQSSFYEELLRIYFPVYYDRLLEHVLGLRRYTRCLSILTLMVAIYCFFILGAVSKGLTVMVIFVFFLFFSSLLEYHQCMRVLFMTYVLSSNIDKPQPSREEIVKHLMSVGMSLKRGGTS